MISIRIAPYTARTNPSLEPRLILIASGNHQR